MMKALSIGMGGALLLGLAAGCQPQLAETGMGDAELQWYSYVSDSYPSFRPPRTAAPATQDKYTTLPNGGEASSEAEAEDPSARPGDEAEGQIQPEAAAEDPSDAGADSLAPESEEGEAPAAENGAAAPAETGKYTEYVVKPGDTLSGIARKFYQDGRLFGRIYEANRDVLPNPNKLPLGAKIRIPQP